MNRNINFDKANQLLKLNDVSSKIRGLNILFDSDLDDRRHLLKGLFNSILSEGDNYLKYVLIGLLAKKKLSEYCPALISIAGDRRLPRYIRTRAIWSLGEIADNEYMVHILRLIIEPYEDIIIAVRIALAKYKEKVLPLALNFLKNPELDLETRKNIIGLITELDIDDNLRFHQLLKFLNSKQEEERLIYINILNDLKAYHLTSKFEKSFGNTSINRTYSLENILNGFKENREKIQQIINNINKIDGQVALKLIVALKKIENDDYSLLEKLIFNEENTHITGMMVSLLGLIGNKKVFPYLVNFLHHPDRRVRANAVESISNIDDIDDDKIVELLMPMLDDFDNRVKANAAKILWKIGGLQMLDILNDMLMNGEKWMKASAAYALGEIGVYQVVDILLSHLDASDIDVKKNIIIALGKTKESDIIPPISSIIMNDEEEFFIRRISIEAIINVGNKEAAETLLRISKIFRDDPSIFELAYEGYRKIVS